MVLYNSDCYVYHASVTSKKGIRIMARSARQRYNAAKTALTHLNKKLAGYEAKKAEYVGIMVESAKEIEESLKAKAASLYADAELIGKSIPEPQLAGSDNDSE
jgi:hypothetical protein